MKIPNCNIRFLLIILGAAFLFSTACKSQKSGSLNTSRLEISECLSLIPDSLFVDRSPKIGISPSQANRLLVDGKIPQEADFCFLELITYDKENDFISFKRLGSDIGLKYDLKLWQGKKQQYLGISWTESEACCTYSQLNFYRIENKKLIDVTKEKVPTILLSEFVNPAFIPENNETNLTYYLELAPTSSSIKTFLEIEAIGLSFEEDIAIAIFENIENKIITLDWEKDKFVINRK